MGDGYGYHDDCKGQDGFDLTPQETVGWTRAFDYEELYRRFEGLKPDIVESGTRGWTWVSCWRRAACGKCGRLQYHSNQIVIALDGACRDNGGSDPRAAIGVYVGEDNCFNFHTPLVSVEDPTNQQAELTAGYAGLIRAITIKKEVLTDLAWVVFKSDSEYLVKGMTSWIMNWKKNGFRTSTRAKVVNRERFEVLEKLVVELNGLGVEVRFWHVPREYNKEADALANKALDREG
ncbi:Ribonuclease H1 [Lachnellula arida]|uniref:ribonuclease H n=1 Tax=Lachnellula arida TaxID=1316785 RepID=A0A8T9BBI1_9HELO|nr:Ribonuclease H1 [Lachnellula arida]